MLQKCCARKEELWNVYVSSESEGSDNWQHMQRSGPKILNFDSLHSLRAREAQVNIRSCQTQNSTSVSRINASYLTGSWMTWNKFVPLSRNNRTKRICGIPVKGIPVLLHTNWLGNSLYITSQHHDCVTASAVFTCFIYVIVKTEVITTKLCGAGPNCAEGSRSGLIVSCHWSLITSSMISYMLDGANAIAPLHMFLATSPF